LYVSPHIVSPANTSHEPNFLPAIPELNGYLSLYTHIYIYTYIWKIYMYMEKSSNKNGRIFQQTVFSLRVFTHSWYPHHILIINEYNISHHLIV
jgi:hypothetical protein